MAETTSDLARSYVRERLATREYAATTARCSRYILAAFCGCCPDDPSRLTKRHVLAWFDTQARCQPSTIAARYGTVRAFVRWLNANGHVRRDPTRGIAGPTRPRRNPRAIDPDDIARLLATAPDPRTRLAISLMACEGLRLSEVCSVQIGDIDWRHLTIDVIGKGDKQRTVHLSPSTANAIRAYLGEHPAPSGVLLRTEDGTRQLSANRLARIVTAHLTDQGVKDRPRDGKSPHAFRHSYGSDLIDEGLTIVEVADLMGHESIDTTMRYQRRVDMRRTRDAVMARSYAQPVGVVAVHEVRHSA